MIYESYDKTKTGHVYEINAKQKFKSMWDHFSACHSLAYITLAPHQTKSHLHLYKN